MAACEHKRFRCTNGIFFCMTCGAQIMNPYERHDEKSDVKKKKGKGVKANGQVSG